MLIRGHRDDERIAAYLAALRELLYRLRQAGAASQCRGAAGLAVQLITAGRILSSRLLVSSMPSLSRGMQFP